MLQSTEYQQRFEVRLLQRIEDQWHHFPLRAVRVLLLFIHQIQAQIGGVPLRHIDALRSVHYDLHCAEHHGAFDVELRTERRDGAVSVLVQTLIYALPSLSNVSWLLALIFFIYGVLGMGLFGGIPHNNDESSFINVHCNFDTFYNSIITLSRIATGESWNGIMRQLHPKECEFMHGEQCGSFITFVYFPSFVIIVSFIILNVFIAVILEHFEVSMNEETSNTLNIKEADVEQFDSAWSRFIEQQYLWYQPKQDGYLWCRVADFELMLMQCDGEFGFKNKNWSRLERFRFLQKLHIPLHFRHSKGKTLYLQYYQVLLAIGLIIMMRRNGEWIQQQITQQTHFAKSRSTEKRIGKSQRNCSTPMRRPSEASNSLRSSQPSKFRQ